ncbi:MAG: serine hydrolase [Candidatus Heimdallarchaeota archaeon]
MSEGYDENRVEGSFEYIYVLPAGLCSSTVVDMSKWIIMLLNNGSYNGTEILKPETVTLMQKDHFVAHPYLPAVNLGLYEMDINNIHIIGHGGDTYYFHSTMALFPELNFGFFISYNSHIGLYANSEFLPVFVSTFFPYTSETIAPMEEYDKGLNDFTGHYISSRRYYSEKTINYSDNYTRNIEMKDYFDIFSEIISVDGYLRFVGLDINFIQVEPDYFREASGDYDMSIAFIRDETGKVSYLYKLHSNYSDI